jgi:hypothetical protein
MLFQLLPILDIMIDFYKKPINDLRFQEYLSLLKGSSKDDMALPIGGFNPMAKEHILEKLEQFKKINAEQIIKEALDHLNLAGFAKSACRDFKVAINVSDDLKGGWTNRFTSDYDSKFRFSGLFSRNFCVPVFWSSESITPEIIKERTLQYVFRTIYWIQHPKTKSLKEHVDQEIFVANHASNLKNVNDKDYKKIHEFYQENANTDDYHIIFNFFYGDHASSSLEFPTYGVSANFTGFDYCRVG